MPQPVPLLLSKQVYLVVAHSEARHPSDTKEATSRATAVDLEGHTHKIFAMPAKQTERRPPLPRRQNPLVAPDKTPDHDELVKMRRLGQTDLTSELVRTGTLHGTKSEHLSYAHLQVPLPENLKNSEIFAPHPHHGTHVGKYFLMRRCSDGFISATGMFKMSYPWAKNSEEHAERDYIKSLEGTSKEESAGNVWVPAHFALELAEEYGIIAWIKALLDEEPIVEITFSEAGLEDEKRDKKNPIPQPPRFEFTANDRTHLPPPSTPRHVTPRPRGRPRGSSPIKNGTVAARTATPRKPRAVKETSKDPNVTNATAVREASTTSLDNAASTSSENLNGESFTVKVESALQLNGDSETTTTNVQVNIPVLSAPERPERIIERAKEMVEEARKLEGEISSRSNTKRKAEVLEDSEPAVEPPPAKKVRVLERELKRERVQKRALIGVAATLLVGYLYRTTFFPGSVILTPLPVPYFPTFFKILGSLVGNGGSSLLTSIAKDAAILSRR